METLTKKAHTEELSKLTSCISQTRSNMEQIRNLLEEIEKRVDAVEKKVGLDDGDCNLASLFAQTRVHT